MAANLCFSNPLSSKLDTNEIVSSSEENFTRMANISHLDLHASNLTVSANNTSLPNNGSEKNDDRNPVKKPNYAVYIDGIIRKTFFEHLFVFAILFFMLVLLMVYVDDTIFRKLLNDLAAWKRNLGRKRNKTWKTKIECGEKSQAKPSEPVTV
ncbi:Adhesion G protein-coupled receptor [Trichinella spiralis]|uniref:Adhesion G protein-coupled receptor n=1 Tax=Trichinella spiralis TaxID=6334 RepID=A0ABR3KPK6_TRISP